jgi:hypothetical protein
MQDRNYALRFTVSLEMAYSDNILTLTYDFLVYLIPELSKFPRDQKFLLADRIESLVLDILDDFIIAYYSKQKIERLREANLKLERLRYLIRLSHDLHLLSNKKYGIISGKINEIGGTVGNWIKSIKQ